MSLRIGIVGFGRIGNEHAGWLSQCQSIDLAGVFDPTPLRREKAVALGIIAFDTLDALLQSDIEAVLISTPTAMHCEQAMLALRAGKHVMIEKPMALDLAQCRQLVETAAEQKKILSVFHNRRWDIDYLTVKQAIHSGIFGRVFNIESRLGQWGSCVGPAAKEWRPGWRNEAAFGGGGLYDWGSHFLDQICQLFNADSNDAGSEVSRTAGSDITDKPRSSEYLSTDVSAKPIRVFAKLQGNVWTKDCDDFARVIIDFDNGCCAMVEINTTTTRPLPRWHIDGTLGSADSPFSLEFDTKKWAELSFAPAAGEAPDRVPIANPGLTETQIWERFASAIRGQGSPAVTAESVLPTMALMDAARESARLGTSTNLD
jgi:scyllo-inositol 2-dehydrogenase (NADP+)